MINKEISRIRNIVREAERQGYVFGNVIPKNVNVTKSQLSKLRSVTREQLLSTARLVDKSGDYLPTKAEKNIEERRQIKEHKRRQREYKHELKQKRKERKLRYKHNTQDLQNDVQYSYNDYSTYYPTLNIIDVIRDKIRELPNTRGFFKKRYGFFYVDFESKKSSLESILDDTLSSVDDFSQLEQYYIENQSRIIELLEITMYDSDGDKVESTFVELAILLKGSALSMLEAQEISDMADMINGY